MSEITEFDLREAAFAFFAGLALCGLAWLAAYPVAHLLREYAL